MQQTYVIVEENGNNDQIVRRVNMVTKKNILAKHVDRCLFY